MFQSPGRYINSSNVRNDGLYIERLVVAINYIFFPHVPWGDFPYRHLADLLQSSGQVSVVYPKLKLPQEADDKVRLISNAEAAEFPYEESVALIASPFILTVTEVHRFKTVIALVTEAPPGVSPDLWSKYMKLLTASAGLIVTSSESVYTDLLFMYDHVLLNSSPQQSSDVNLVESDRRKFIEAMDLVIKRRPIDFIKRSQLDEQLAYYKLLSQADDSNELVWYLQSFYHYMLGEATEAASCLQRSFAASVLSGRKDALSTRFRFLSAIHALNGEPDRAIHTYGITCITDEERSHYDRLRKWYEQGAKLMAMGELLLLIGDMRTASRLLTRSNDDRAAPLLRSIAIHIGDVKQALTLSVPSAATSKQSIMDHSINEKLHGLLHLQQGDRRMAMRHFWRASAHTQTFGEMFELEAIDRALENQSAGVLLQV
jgi:hypothetical protein